MSTIPLRKAWEKNSFQKDVGLAIFSRQFEIGAVRLTDSLVHIFIYLFLVYPQHSRTDYMIIKGEIVLKNEPKLYQLNILQQF